MSLGLPWQDDSRGRGGKRAQISLTAGLTGRYSEPLSDLRAAQGIQVLDAPGGVGVEFHSATPAPSVAPLVTQNASQWPLVRPLMQTHIH